METLTKESLFGFTGTENYHKFSVLFPRMYLTDGAKHVASVGGAFWLMDAIASYQPVLSKHKWAKEAQFWELKVSSNKTAVLTCCRDKNYIPTVSQKIEYTDFPLESIKLWVMPANENSMVIMLPSEY